MITTMPTPIRPLPGVGAIPRFGAGDAPRVPLPTVPSGPHVVPLPGPDVASGAVRLILDGADRIVTMNTPVQ